jgi:hypothetical protein
MSTEKWLGTFHHLIRLINDKKLSLMMDDSQYDLSNVKEAVDVVESSKIAKGKVFLTSYRVNSSSIYRLKIVCEAFSLH